MYKYLSILIFLLLCYSSFAQEVIFPNPLSARTSNYTISVELDTEKKMVYAKETLVWKNPSADTVSFIQFHLFLNAFKNTLSTFSKESIELYGNNYGTRLQEEDWGWIHIDKVEDVQRNDWTAHLHYIQPDDDNEHDQTVIQLDLPQPVLPYDSITLHLNFTSKIPKIRVRTGYNKDFFHIVQWFPKTGVYEPAGTRFATKGQWNCHQYHRSSEYFGEYGNFDVDITVPSNYLMGATGKLYKEEVKDDKKTYYFHAEDVIDFAWTTSPSLLHFKDAWKEVQIDVFIAPEYDCCLDRYISAAKYAFDYMGERLMPYPYTGLTIIVPPFHAVNAGAMEYPTLITAPGLYHFPNWIRTPEYFVIHEFVHQYFHLMVGTNEFEEAWMDEGFTSYWKSRILDETYGKKSSVIDLGLFQMGAMEFFRSRYVGMKNRKVAESTRAGWEYTYDKDRALFYSKPATWLRTLEGILGRETMDEIMYTFFHRWKFKHPCRYDFIDVVNEVVPKKHGTKYGENMNWYFDQVLYGTGDCDYEVTSISNRLLAKEEIGIFKEKGMEVERIENQDSQKGRYISRVVVARLGDIYVPQEVLIHFEDGTERLEQWDGKARTFGFEYQGNVKVDYVILDPAEKIYIDNNLINNSLRTESDTKTIWKYISRFMVFMQNTLQSVSLFA